jgi:aryl-alcohol dehydrogenase-like predicted oxidoreductase
MNFDRIVSNQPRYNMIQRQIEAEIIPLCKREGVGQVVFSPSPRECSRGSTVLEKLLSEGLASPIPSPKGSCSSS